MEELNNLLSFAIEESTLSYDLDDRPIIDEERLLEMLAEIVEKRERALKHRVKQEFTDAIKIILQNN
jgi:hypothetical protein